MVNASDTLIARLLRRYAPDNYHVGANARCTRVVRQVTLFARHPLPSPTADFHNRYVLLLGIGEATAVIAGAQRHVIRHGQALLIHPYTLHRYEVVDGARQPLAFLGFESELGDDGADAVLLDGLNAGVLPMSGPSWEVLDRIERTFDTWPAGVPALTLALLEHLAAETPMVSPSLLRHVEWERTQRVARIARHQPNFTVTDLVRACASSESVLRTAVLATTGMPIARFMRQIRLQNTLALVSRRQVGLAVARAGYVTTEAYCKAFKAEFGMAPSRFAELAETGRWRILPKAQPG